MTFNLLDYYKALNGESSETNGIWHINHNKQHAYRISSDYDALDVDNKKITLPPSVAETDLINIFSDKLGQKLKNTKITDNGDGTESVDLELDDRIVTIIIDQSGSMTWNDHNNFRHDVATDLVNKIMINYPGDITYNLIEYGADIINVLFFGVKENDAFDPNDIDSFSKMIKADDQANYDGMRIIRNDDHYPTSPLDGEVVDDGFISRIKDEGLIEGQAYYYTVYTYDKNYKFSVGTRIKVTPQERIIPRSHSNFRSVVESEDLTKGIPFIGTGVNRDANTVAIWHMDEGEGKYIYDFSDTGAILEFNKENPTWYESRFVPSGSSGLFFDGNSDAASVFDVSELSLINKESVTISFWLYPYDTTSLKVICNSNIGNNYSLLVYSFAGAINCLQKDWLGNLRSVYSNSVMEEYKWQHVCFTCSSVDHHVYINGVDQTSVQTVTPTAIVPSGQYHFHMGAWIPSVLNMIPYYQYRGKITEFSLHTTARDLDYVQSQLETDFILDKNGNQVGTEVIGRKEDNGDRLSIFKYDVPRDYNYVGGEVFVVRNEKNIPSWEGDGDVVYQESDPGAGQFFISDPDDFVLGENYYYRLFTQNSLGNVSFLSDSPSLEVAIPKSSTSDYYLSLDSAIDSPEPPDIGQLITAGNGKTYLRWKQNDPIDSRIARVKIFYSSSGFPVVNSNGGYSGQLVFTGLSTDTKFVHRNITNDINAYYTIVNVDKYGRSSNYDSDGVQVDDFLHASIMPSASANENTFPLIDVENINYELVDENTVTIGWNQPQKSIKNIDAYFDQTVYIYGAISDEFGDAVSEDTPIRMSITSVISKESQADDVFGDTSEITFQDVDAYDFFVSKTGDGFFKGILRMTSNLSIISQVKEATFKIQLKALIPKQGGYIPPNDNTVNSNSISEYTSLVEELTLATSEASTASSSDNFYEYYSEIIEVHFTNPWEITLVNRDNQKVPQKCYCLKEDKITGEMKFNQATVQYNGVYMKATNPFVARAKVKYKGLPIESGNIQISVWDALSDNLCQNACVEEDPGPFEGQKDKKSVTVLPPDNSLPVVQGQEETYLGSGVYTDISFVDIPLYAPKLPQAVRVFVKGEKAGYSSIKDMYVLFQSVLQIDISSSSQGNALTVDGKDISEFSATAFIINPDYPNYQTNSFDASLVTYPDDLTIIQWEKNFVQTMDGAEKAKIGPLYSTDSVPLTNGIYSYCRNGTARNIFLGPVPKGDKDIHEDHEIKASIVYRGLSSFAKMLFTIGPYIPKTFDRTSARFLMEIDGGWKGSLPNESYGGGGWKSADSYPLWADGIHYKKIKISRNPRVAENGNGVDQFAYADCFRTCAAQDDNEILELSSGQIIEVSFGSGLNATEESSALKDKEVEFIHGEVYEIEDPYTGLHYLEIGEEGFIDNGKAFIELNSEEVSDVTYFYVRINKNISDSGLISNENCEEEVIINGCSCLNGEAGITECDIPLWQPTEYLYGKTTVFLNNNPLVLNGGGSMYTGIPPCPICLNEPLRMITEFRKVTNYYYSEDFGDPSNDFLYAVETFTDKNSFTDEDGETLVKYTSDIEIRIKVYWRGGPVPDGTPIYTSVGDNTSSSLFVARQNIYYTKTGDDGDSYVDVLLNARRYSSVTVTEQVEIFSIYDENEKTERHIGQDFSLTLDKKDKEIDGYPVLPTDPSTGIISDTPITPYSATVHRYNIDTDRWEQISSMREGKGNGFSGASEDYIYYMGGMLGNSLNISNRNEKYDIINDVWSDATKMLTPRFGGMSITIGDDIYLIGGVFSDIQKGGELSVSTKVEVYHTDVDTWEELEHLPIVDEGSAFEEELGVAFGTASHIYFNDKNYIYIMSGFKKAIINESQFNVQEYNQRILRYCVEDDEWEYSGVLRSNELNTYQRLSPLSIIFDNKIIVFGGAILDGNNFLYPVEDFYIDFLESFVVPASGQWLTFDSGYMGDFPEPKFQSAMVEHNLNPSTDIADYYVFGGSNDSSSSLDIVEKITTSDSEFIYQSSYMSDLTSMPTGKHGASVEFSNTNGTSFIYVMGGYTVNKDDDYIDIEFGI